MLGGDVCVGWSARTGLTQVTPMHGDHMPEDDVDKAGREAPYTSVICCAVTCVPVAF